MTLPFLSQQDNGPDLWTMFDRAARDRSIDAAIEQASARIARAYGGAR